MSDDENLSDHDYTPPPMKVVAHMEACPVGTMERIAQLEAALRKAETVMMIVEPRSDKREYLETLQAIRAALAPKEPT